MDKRRRQLHWTVLDRWPVTVGPPTGQTERVGTEAEGAGVPVWLCALDRRTEAKRTH